MKTVRDHLWLWGHVAGSHDTGWNTPATSRMTPAEAAWYMNVPNLIMVRYEDKPTPPYKQYARSLQPLQQFVWSIVGAGGATGAVEVEAVKNLAAQHPSMTGVMMDDFFRDDSDRPGVYSPEDLKDIRENLSGIGRPLDVWVVLYDRQLDLPIRDHLALCDVVTFWTWRGENLDHLEENFGRFERLPASNRKVLGCYMWDYGNRRPMPLKSMEKQCTLALEWLKQGRIEGIIFLASCICDLGLDAVEWTREWIRDAGHEPIQEAS